MNTPSRGSSGRALMAAALLWTVTGCDGDQGAGLTGLLAAGSEDLSRYGDTVLLRAVPDYIDGFSPSRPYTGERFFEASCPLEHTDLPLDFMLLGDNRDVQGAPPRWLLLAWIGDDEDETWVAPGQLYGTTTFEFYPTSRTSSWADGLVVNLDQVSGAR